MKFKKTIFPLLLLAFFLLNSNVCLGQEAQPITVEARGIGTGAFEARKDAIANALRQVVGEYIEADTVIENEEVVTDTITAFTNSSDVKSEILDRGFEGDNVWVICKVTIVPSQIVGKIRDAALSAVNIDGEALAAELEANQDNIELQKETLENLFKGIAPRLLVARLIDREGNPIEDGRIPKDDIMYKGDEVLFALNIEIYYDLETYYTKVYPNLNRVLRAVAVKYLPAEVEVSGKKSSTGSAFTNYPAILTEHHLNWATNSNSLNLDTGGRIKDQNPRNFTLLLSRSRNRFGTEEGFDAYIISNELLAPITAFSHDSNETHPKLRVVLESTSGNVIDRKEIPIVKHAFNSNDGKKQPIPFNEGFHQQGDWVALSTWQINPRAVSSQYPLLITPTFKSKSHSHDTLVIRQYLTLHKEDFKKLAKISFDFWDPRANTKAQYKNRGNGRTAGSRGR
jgi:hypothetical protein